MQLKTMRDLAEELKLENERLKLIIAELKKDFQINIACQGENN